MMLAVFSNHAVNRLRSRFGVSLKVGQRWLSEAREAKALELLTTTHCLPNAHTKYWINPAKQAVFVLAWKERYWLVLTCLRQLRQPRRLKRKQRRELSEDRDSLEAVTR